MFIAETGNSDKPICIGYKVVGSEQQIDRTINYVSSLVLGAVQDRLVERDKAEDFLAWFISGSVISNDKDVLAKVHEQSEPIKERRISFLAEQAFEGQITTAQFIEEGRLLRSSESVNWLNRDRQDSTPTSRGFRTYVAPDVTEVYGAESIEAQVAKRLNLRELTWQFELVQEYDREPYLLSDRSHCQLGYMENSEFVPIVTVLNKNHPAAQLQRGQ